MVNYDRNSIYDMLAMGSDPFRNGTDCCCAVHTAAGNYRRALNEIRAYENGADADVPQAIRDMEKAYREILESGYRMCGIYAKILVLEMGP